MGIISDELVKVKTAYATPRRTVILDSDADVEDEDLIQREDMVVTGRATPATSSACRSRPIARKGAAARAAGHADARGGFRRQPVRRLHASRRCCSSLRAGQVYKEKVWRLPLAAPQARGKALVNLLPLEQDERITTIMPLPEDEESWEALDVMFATTRGTVRRNKLSDFAQVNRAGKIAMRLDEGERIVDVQICSDKDDVLLTTARGQCIRFCRRRRARLQGPRFDGRARHRAGRGRQRDLAGDPQHRSTRRRPNAPPISSSAARRAEGEAVEEAERARTPKPRTAPRPMARALESERFDAMQAAEQVILTISENGYGKRTSSFEYRVTGRGGKGIVAMAVNARNGALVASFPVEESDEIMLVTDGGQLIRVPRRRHPHRRARRRRASSSSTRRKRSTSSPSTASARRAARPEKRARTEIGGWSRPGASLPLSPVDRRTDRSCDGIRITLACRP